jgi:hypothetical protein
MCANGCVRGTLYCPANPEQNADELWDWYVRNGYRVTGYPFTFPNTLGTLSTNWNFKLIPESIEYGALTLGCSLLRRTIMHQDVNNKEETASAHAQKT